MDSPPLRRLLPYLICPVCGDGLAPAADGRSVRCHRGHSFDIARQGYVHLGAGPLRTTGDSAAMVAARTDVLASGAYDVVSDALARAAGGRHGLVLDVGAGTGHHLGRVLDALPGTVGLAVDVAKPAVRRAARAHPRAGAVLADTWRALPVADRSAAVLLNVFAPRNGAEFARVLAPDGLLLVVTPTDRHLAELPELLNTAAGVRLLRVDPAKPDRVAAGLARWFESGGETVHEQRRSLTPPLVRQLVLMGPSAAHTDPAALDRAVTALPAEVTVTVSVRLGRYHPR